MLPNLAGGRLLPAYWPPAMDIKMSRAERQIIEQWGRLIYASK